MATYTQNKKALAQWRDLLKFIKSETPINVNETKADQIARIAKAKTDYKYFVEYYLPHLATVETPDFHIKAAKKIKRNKHIKIWLKWGRGLAKSVVADVTVPLWLWINNDIKFMVLIGENQDKAELLLEDLRAIFESNQRIIHDFGVQHNPGNWTQGAFITKNGFIARAIGMGVSPRGFRVGGVRPDYIGCDDWENRETEDNPKRQKKIAKWLLTAVLPIVDAGNSRVVLAQNHFAPQMIFTLITKGKKAWKIMRINAYYPINWIPRWKAKYSPSHYKNKAEEMGILACKAEYNNDPHVEGTIFTDEMIQWGKIPQLRYFDHICGKWDVAYSDKQTADYNAIRIWGIKDGHKYLIDCFVRQCKIKDAVQFISAYQKSLPGNVSVRFGFEAQFWNESILGTIKEVETEQDIKLNLVKDPKPTKKKYDRMLEMHPDYQNGVITYNAKLEGHNSTAVGLAQLKGIEPGYKTNDDAPDADKAAFDELDKFKKGKKGLRRFQRREKRGF